MLPLRVLALEPYYGGSHRAFLDVWTRHSCHDWTLQTLPPRHWKWRMRGSAMWFAEQQQRNPVGEFDVIFTCDMTAVADLRALLPEHLRNLPIACYFHENQLTYPLSPTDWRDYQYGFTNVTSALAADAVWFNSEAHRTAFFEAAATLLRQMSDHVPRDVLPAIEAKSTVQYPAVESVGNLKPRYDRPAGPLRILWSHRWEYDKNPEAFFGALLKLHEAKAPFQLILAGEQFRKIPPAFAAAHAALKPHIAHTGYIESQEDYLALIQSCDVTVSTAIQENFGIAIVEAILAGCHPILPDRLSYPELLPADVAQTYLFRDDNDLLDRLRHLCDDPSKASPSPELIRHASKRFSATNQVPRLDEALAVMVESVA